MEPLDPGGTHRVPFYQCIKTSLKSVVRDESVIAALASHSFLAHWFPYRSYTFDLLIQAQLGNISARDLAVAKKIALPAARVRPPVLGLLMPQQLPLIRASPTLAAT